jgi:hypothetical protein
MIGHRDNSGSALEIGFAVVADYALVDQAGKLSILGIFRHLLAPTLPVVHPRMFVCLALQFEPSEIGSEHELTLSVTDPDGNRIAGQETMAFTVRGVEGDERPGGMQAVFELVGVQFAQHGVHTIDIVIDGQRRASIPLQITRTPARAAR